MTSSRKPGSDLPPTIPSMWRLCKLGLRYEPALMSVSLGLALLGALPDAFVALWFKVMAAGVSTHDMSRVRFGAIALGISGVATWFLRVVGSRITRRFRDKVTIALESHVARLQASIPTIAHQE